MWVLETVLRARLVAFLSVLNVWVVGAVEVIVLGLALGVQVGDVLALALEGPPGPQGRSRNWGRVRGPQVVRRVHPACTAPLPTDHNLN